MNIRRMAIAICLICIASLALAPATDAQSCPLCQESSSPVGNPELSIGKSLEGGTFLAQAALRYSEYTDRLHAHHQNEAILLSMAAQLSEELNVSATLPYKFLKIEEHNGRPAIRDQGIGDLTTTLTWSPWAWEADPKAFWDYRRLSFIVGFHWPSGASDLDHFANAPGDIVPLGNGTYDFLVGAAYSAPLGDTWRLFDTFLLTIPLNKDDRIPPPGTILGSRSTFTVFDRIGVYKPFGEVVSAHLALDLLWKAQDASVAVSKDDGGFFVWGAPGFTLQTSSGSYIDISGQIPLTGGNPSVTIAFAIRF